MNTTDHKHTVEIREPNWRDHPDYADSLIIEYGDTEVTVPNSSSRATIEAGVRRAIKEHDEGTLALRRRQDQMEEVASWANDHIADLSPLAAAEAERPPPQLPDPRMPHSWITVALTVVVVTLFIVAGITGVLE